MVNAETALFSRICVIRGLFIRVIRVIRGCSFFWLRLARRSLRRVSTSNSFSWLSCLLWTCPRNTRKTRKMSKLHSFAQHAESFQSVDQSVYGFRRACEILCGFAPLRDAPFSFVSFVPFVDCPASPWSWLQRSPIAIEGFSQTAYSHRRCRAERLWSRG